MSGGRQCQRARNLCDHNPPGRGVDKSALKPWGPGRCFLSRETSSPDKPPQSVIPAQAGTQFTRHRESHKRQPIKALRSMNWVPACAGMTIVCSFGDGKAADTHPKPHTTFPRRSEANSGACHALATWLDSPPAGPGTSPGKWFFDFIQETGPSGQTPP